MPAPMATPLRDQAERSSRAASRSRSRRAVRKPKAGLSTEQRRQAAEQLSAVLEQGQRLGLRQASTSCIRGLTSVERHDIKNKCQVIKDQVLSASSVATSSSSGGSGMPPGQLDFDEYMPDLVEDVSDDPTKGHNEPGAKATDCQATVGDQCRVRTGSNDAVGLAVLEVGRMLNRASSQVQPFISILENNWYDTMRSLAEAPLEHLVQLGIPQHFAKELISHAGLIEDFRTKKDGEKGEKKDGELASTPGGHQEGRRGRARRRYGELACPPGTFRWIIEDDHKCELLVIDAYLMPVEFVRWAKNAFKTFVFPDKNWRPITELMVGIEDEFRWISGNWPHGSLAENAVSARVPAGFFKDVWAVAQNGDKANRQRSLAMALMIASALLRPLQAADTNVNKELGHDKFQRLVDEASGELWRARGRRLADDTFERHIMVDEVPMDEVPVDEVPVDEVPMDEVPVDEVPGRSSEESDSECMSYEEYRTRKALHGSQGLGG